MDNNQRIELLKDVFTLIYPDLVKEGSEEQERDNEERRNRVQAWLHDAKQAAAQEQNPWKDEPQGRGEQLSVMPRFLQLLRECLLSHHWAQLLAMLTCLTHLPYGTDWAVWKATMTTMYTEPENNISFIQEFFKHTYLLKECNVTDIALEFVQYLISQGKTQEASKVIQTARKGNPRNKSEYQRELTDHCLMLLEAYQGMIFYSDWKTALSEHQQSQSQSFFSSSQMSQSFYNLTSSQGPSEEAVESMARRATLSLDAVVKKPGVWDIFLTKSVEIHEYYEEYSEAEQLLCAYRNRNPDNPNAHRFLYEHLTRCCSHHDEKYVQEESVYCLKGLTKLDPANPLVLTLWEMLTDGGESGEALCHAFDLLDYGHWQTRPEGWQCLAKSLAAGLSRKRYHKQQQQEEDVKETVTQESFMSVLDNCWSSRHDWWPLYHFDCDASARTPGRDDHQQLLSSKAFVAAVLIDRGCSFTKEARELLNASTLQALDESLSELNWAAVSEFRARHATAPWEQLPGNTVVPTDGATSPLGSGQPSPSASPSLTFSSGRPKKRRKERCDTQSDVECAPVSEFTVRQAPLLVSETPGDACDGASSSSAGDERASPSVVASCGPSKQRKKASPDTRSGLDFTSLSDVTAQHAPPHSDQVSATQTNHGNDPCSGTSEDVRPVERRRLKLAKRKEKRTDTGGSALKNSEASDEALSEQRTDSGSVMFKIWGMSEDTSYLFNQQTLEETASSSSKHCAVSGDALSLLHQQTIEETTSSCSSRKKKKKRKRRADNEDENEDWMPEKKKRKER